jgi:pimeloyl-ACP methyl ester carboxylesterase
VTGTPALHVDEPRGPACGIALVLHGGREHSLDPVRSGQLAVVRMLPFAAALRRAGSPHGLVVARLRYAVRGWNGGVQSPVADARWALGRLDERFPGVPVALVGHSMGGRTALHVAAFPTVRSVVGLAPWIEETDPVAQLRGRRVLIVHGDRDRVTSPRRSAEYARAASAVAESVSYVAVRAEGHAMLRRAGVWHRLAAGFVTGVLCGAPVEGTAGGETTNVVGKALAGQAALVV